MKLTQSKPLFTIAIPTWNRSGLLCKTLQQLHAEIQRLPSMWQEVFPDGAVEVLVSDNCSPDDTPLVVQQMMVEGLEITYIRNETNIGSDANIAACFNNAAGRYVLIMGDDDLFVDYTLAKVLDCLNQQDYGVVYLRPFGFETDFREEMPFDLGRNIAFANSADFLVKLGSRITFISSCVMNKSLIPEVDANAYCGTNLVQVELVLQSVLAAQKNYYFGKYVIACLRNNSGGYDYSSVFVNNLCQILDRYVGKGLSAETIHRIENNMLMVFYPYHLTMQRMNVAQTNMSSQENFKKRFHSHWIYKLLLAPILNWPRPLAVVWGSCLLLVGRAMNGELNRGLHFFWHKLKKTVALSR